MTKILYLLRIELFQVDLITCDALMSTCQKGSGNIRGQKGQTVCRFEGCAMFRVEGWTRLKSSPDFLQGF